MAMSGAQAHYTSPWRGEVGVLGRALARLSASGGGRSRHPFDISVARSAPTPALPRKREREFNCDPQRRLIAKSGIMLPPPAP